MKIDRVHEFNFLGLTMNENLNWKSHINKISNKVSKCIGILNKLKHFLPLKTKVPLYSSLILSHLNFAVLVWGYECERIIKLQKNTIRIISRSKYNPHTEPIFKTLKLLKVKDILTLQELKFYYKYKHNKLPHYFQNLPIGQIRKHIFMKQEYKIKFIYQKHDMNMQNAVHKLICQRSLIALQLKLLAKSIPTVFRGLLGT